MVNTSKTSSKKKNQCYRCLKLSTLETDFVVDYLHMEKANKDHHRSLQQITLRVNTIYQLIVMRKRISRWEIQEVLEMSDSKFERTMPKVLSKYGLNITYHKREQVYEFTDHTQETLDDDSFDITKQWDNLFKLVRKVKID